MVAQVSPNGCLRSIQKTAKARMPTLIPGDDEDVVGPGALEVGLDVAAKEGAATDQRGLHQCAALARPQLHDVREGAAPRRTPPQADATAGESWQHFNIVGARRAGQANALRVEIAHQIHGAGIAIVARHSQLCDQTQPLAIGVNPQRGFLTVVARFFLLVALAVNREPDADRSRELAIVQTQLLALHVDRFLFAAIRAVADQAFANDVRHYVNFILAGREELKIFGDGRLRCIASLKIESSKRDE